MSVGDSSSSVFPHFGFLADVGVLSTPQGHRPAMHVALPCWTADDLMDEPAL